MTKLEQQLKLAEEGGFSEIVIPVEEAREWVKLLRSHEKEVLKDIIRHRNEVFGIQVPAE